MKHLLCLVCLATTTYVQLSGAQTTNDTDKGVCFEQVGCFSNAPPFRSPQRPLILYPQSPDRIKTKFLLFTRESQQTPQELDARNPTDALTVWTNFKSRETKFLIHGFLDTIKLRPWMKEMVAELLKFADFNVIVVDWSGGNQLPYTQATANTRIVGAQIAVLVNYLIGTQTITAGDVHIIGHSLGAQTAGYAGERIPRLRRITGLDPAGPYYGGTERPVRLDETDALFVDTIHTDMADILIAGLGTTDLSGHANFYPNGGHNQPGCPGAVPNLLQGDILNGIIDTVTCNHIRAYQYFMESINSPCPFTGFPCASESDFQNKKCQGCGVVGCSRMGFHADKYRLPEGQIVKYYLNTAGSSPYCRFSYTVVLKLATGSWSSVKGVAAVSIAGGSIRSSWITLTGSTPVSLDPGRTYTFDVDVPENLSNITAVNFWWEKSFSLWSLFSDTPSIYVEQIVLLSRDSGVKYTFCAKNPKVASDTNIPLNQPC